MAIVIGTTMISGGGAEGGGGRSSGVLGAPHARNWCSSRLLPLTSVAHSASSHPHHISPSFLCHSPSHGFFLSSTGCMRAQTRLVAIPSATYRHYRCQNQGAPPQRHEHDFRTSICDLSHSDSRRGRDPKGRPVLTSLFLNQKEFSIQKERIGRLPQPRPSFKEPHDLKLWNSVTSTVNGLRELCTGRLGIVLLSLPTIAGFSIEGPQSVLEALGVLAAVVIVHEGGHFLAAYFQGIHVSQFSIGFGPTLLKFQGKRVEYCIKAVPLGGYVAFPEDDPENDYARDDPDLLKNRPILDRLLVISAGVVANIVFAYSILFGQVLTIGLLHQEYFPGVVIPEVLSSSVAARAGFKAGDLIVGVDGKVLTGENCVFDLVNTIKDNPDRKLSFFVSRQGRQLEVQVAPERNLDGTGKIGVQLAPNARPARLKADNLADGTVRASKEFSRLFGVVANGLKQLVFNFSETADKISGPIAIVAVGAEVARSDIAGLFQFAAIVNINLAVVNILPLPALDGGYLALIAFEAARGGKRLPNKVEQGIMSSGFLLLLVLGTFLMVKDALNLGFAQLL